MKYLLIILAILTGIKVSAENHSNYKKIIHAQKKYLYAANQSDIFKQSIYNLSKVDSILNFINSNDTIYMIENPSAGGIVYYKSYKKRPYYCIITDGKKYFSINTKSPNKIQIGSASVDDDLVKCYLHLVKEFNYAELGRIAKSGCFDCSTLILTRLVNGNVDVYSLPYMPCSVIKDIIQ